MNNGVKLNYINKSNASTPLQIAITLTNPASGDALVWQLIQYCAINSSHPFVVPPDSQLCVNDSYGNYLAPLEALPGQLFSVQMGASGTELVAAGTSANPQSVDVTNGLEQATVNVVLNKAGKPSQMHHNLMPSQLVSFVHEPQIYIGVVANTAAGAQLAATPAAGAFTEINLIGIASADIVMTGGGNGAEAPPYQFTLTNVTPA